MDLLVIDEVADAGHDAYGYQLREQIVVAETRSIAVEEEQHHDGHKVHHHETHTRHLRLARGRLLITEV